MDRPTGSDIRSWTPPSIDWSEYGYPQASGGTDALDRPVAEAAARFAQITGLSWSSIEDAIATVQPPLTWTDLQPMVERAAFGLTLLQVAQSQPDYMETLADFDLIGSMTVGAYSETRRSPGDAAKARLLVAWPWLSELLWGLLTPDRYDYYVMFFGGANAPAWEVSEPDWRTNDLTLEAGGFPAVGGETYGHGGWWG